MSWGKIGVTLGLFLLLGILFLSNLQGIPFHPDETSLLFESRDFELILRNPLSVSYNPTVSMDRMMEYRALNAPLAKYTLAIGRRAMGVGPEAVGQDWNWQKSWQENLQAGAFPSPRALIGARWMSAFLALLAAPVLFTAGYQLGGWRHGVTVAGLYGLSGYVLLHGRRSMAEGTLLFSTSLLIIMALIGRRRPFLAGLAAALAFASKHSALPLLIMPLFGIAWLRTDDPPMRARVRDIALLLSTFIVVTVLLNPFMWQHPLQAIPASINARLSFVEEQQLMTESLAPGSTLDRPGERLASLIGNSFVLPIQFQEVGNYRSELAASIEVYRQDPLHQLLTGPAQGTFLLSLFIFGFWGAWRERFFKETERRKNHAVLLTGTLAMGATLLFFNPLPYQRYYLPLLPLFCLWEATGLTSIIKGLERLYKERTSQPPL